MDPQRTAPAFPTRCQGQGVPVAYEASLSLAGRISMGAVLTHPDFHKPHRQRGEASSGSAGSSVVTAPSGVRSNRLSSGHPLQGIATV